MILALFMCVVALGAIAYAIATTRSRSDVEDRLKTATRNLEFLQHAFSKFAPATVVDHILAQGISPAPEKKEVTVLFADLRGFTAMSETMDPVDLVKLLNGYFGAMSRAISDNNGHVSKFIGDGILALFGALETNAWQSNDAGHAALAMREALAAYNEELRAAGLPTIAIGIGIHRGVVVAGCLGSQQLMEYTVIGSQVNLAARVESMTREHGVDILVTAAVRQHLDPRFRLRPLPPTRGKGLSEEVVIFAIEGMSERGAELAPVE